MLAEQCVNTRPQIKVLKGGERVIVDHDLTVSRTYLYFYLALNVGAIIGETGKLNFPLEAQYGWCLTGAAMVYSEKYVGFWLAYTLPLAMFLIAPCVLLWGRKRYVRSPPAGSVLSKAWKLWRLATKGQWSANPIKT